MKHNFKTNRLEGVPKEWAKKYRLPLEVDMDKTVDTKHLPPEIRPSGQLPKTLIDFIENKGSIIRPPVLNLTNFRANSADHLAVNCPQVFQSTGEPSMELAIYQMSCWNKYTYQNCLRTRSANQNS